MEGYIAQYGKYGFYESVEARHACCGVRKLKPLARALSGASFWITGLRRGQSGNRATTPFAEFDAERGLIKPPFLIQGIFGVLGGIGADLENLTAMKQTADRLFGDQYHWSVLGAGRHQLPIAAMSVAMGANLRVGLEDSLWLGPGQLAKSNADQVKAARMIIEGLGLDVATPADAREMLQLKGADKVNF